MTETDYEWRTFGPITNDQERAILALELFRNESIIDNYLLSQENQRVNVKLRERNLKAKVLALDADEDGIELWESYSFILPQEIGRLRYLMEQTGFPLPVRRSPEEMLAAIPDAPNPHLMHLPIRKDRKMRLYQTQGHRTGVDISYFTLFQKPYRTIGIEAKTKQAVRQLLADFHLCCRPQNYTQFLSEKLQEQYDWRGL